MHAEGQVKVASQYGGATNFWPAAHFVTGTNTTHGDGVIVGRLVRVRVSLSFVIRDRVRIRSS